ncbi:MAG TPA: hypothetical protein VHQ90_16660 [Thermoanaerobaculia bacterium]|nr:hypothetical protein [Thermoanaerobaculia bacterium]
MPSLALGGCADLDPRASGVVRGGQRRGGATTALERSSPFPPTRSFSGAAAAPGGGAAAPLAAGDQRTAARYTVAPTARRFQGRRRRELFRPNESF